MAGDVCIRYMIERSMSDRVFFGQEPVFSAQRRE